MSFNFKDLDLSDVDADSGPESNRIGVGTHEVTVTDASIDQCKNPKHYRLRVNFHDKNQNTIRNDFNVVNANDQAVKIGKEQLKALLEASKHPNPDKPDDVSSLKGLKVQIKVALGKARDDGSQWPEIKSYMPVGGDINDEIPF
jgi:hypothetical protein